jgi:hypothetical protein
VVFVGGKCSGGAGHRAWGGVRLCSSGDALSRAVFGVALAKSGSFSMVSLARVWFTQGFARPKDAASPWAPQNVPCRPARTEAAMTERGGTGKKGVGLILGSG